MSTFRRFTYEWYGTTGVVGVTAAQMDITASFGPEVRERRDRADALRSRAKNLHDQWSRVFGPHDTPMPIDGAWHQTEVALRNIQSPTADASLEAASDRLEEAEWIIQQESECNDCTVETGTNRGGDR